MYWLWWWWPSVIQSSVSHLSLNHWLTLSSGHESQAWWRYEARCFCWFRSGIAAAGSSSVQLQRRPLLGQNYIRCRQAGQVEWGSVQLAGVRAFWRCEHRSVCRSLLMQALGSSRQLSWTTHALVAELDLQVLPHVFCIVNHLSWWIFCTKCCVWCMAPLVTTSFALQTFFWMKLYEDIGHGTCVWCVWVWGFGCLRSQDCCLSKPRLTSLKPPRNSILMHIWYGAIGPRGAQ